MRKKWALVCLIASAAVGTSGRAADYVGACDGSAVAMIDPLTFVTVSDEEPVLKIYPLNGGTDLQTRRTLLSSSLGFDPKDEGDIEAAAKIGNTVYWIASLGSGKKGGAEPSRRRFFATRVGDKGQLTVLGTPASRASQALFETLVHDPALAPYHLEEAALLPPKSPGALNIEGLAPNGKDGVLIGFRNPTSGPDANAILVDLINPEQVVLGTHAPTLARVIMLDLGRRGIRDIAYRPAHKDYLVLAGAIDEVQNFAIYRWSGDISQKPIKLDADFQGTGPEALVELDDGRLLVLSDDGELKNADGVPCKKLPEGQKHFRGIIISKPD